MEYKELQNQAKELGLPYNKVSTEELTRSIKEAREKQTSQSGDHKQKTETPEEKAFKKEKDQAKSKEKASEANTAIVLDGNHEVRQYELGVHGKDFEKLAHEFATKRGYTVKVDNLAAGVHCPNCGTKLNLKKLTA